MLRRQLRTQLPIDALTTHYPDRRGQVPLNIALSPSADAALHRIAAVLGQRPQEVLSQWVTADLARHAPQERARRLENRLESLLVHHTLEEVLVCAARVHPSRRHHCIPAAQ
ncbi:hypothetical protein ABZ865_41440 [Streptomyces sp. NPDC047085]|uniref:hypothetical protein n=1 Tax=Streptomyces sp. NPDC047085 TaxID=3155140 RepID=UPI0033E0B6E0